MLDCLAKYFSMSEIDKALRLAEIPQVASDKQNTESVPDEACE